MIPFFTSQYSGKSILTFDLPEKAKKHHKQSILQICQENNIVNPFIVEDKMTGFMEMFQNCQQLEIKPRFGLRYDYNSGTTDEDNQKIILFVNNTNGYKNLIKIHNAANRSNGSVINNTILNDNAEDITLVIPFYDSYIFNNNLQDKTCFPPQTSIDTFYAQESNGLPFDRVISSLIPSDAKKIKCKSIFYRNDADFNVWLTYRCALNLLVAGGRRSLEEPKFDHCASNNFSFESYLRAC